VEKEFWNVFFSYNPMKNRGMQVICGLKGVATGF
jgi:hypothetical protein